MKVCFACGCCCCVFILITGVQAIRWSTWPSCDSGSTIAWNTVLPQNGTMQFRREWFSGFTGSKIDVYNATQNWQTGSMGYWTEISALWGKKYTFVDEALGGIATMEGNPPWPAFYLGIRYAMWPCGAPDTDIFHVEQDYWATSSTFSKAQGERVHVEFVERKGDQVGRHARRGVRSSHCNRQARVAIASWLAGQEVLLCKCSARHRPQRVGGVHGRYLGVERRQK